MISTPTKRKLRLDPPLKGLANQSCAQRTLRSVALATAAGRHLASNICHIQPIGPNRKRLYPGPDRRAAAEISTRGRFDWRSIVGRRSGKAFYITLDLVRTI